MTSTTEAATSYLDLLITYQPRHIRSEAEADRIQGLIDELIDKGNLSADERDFLLLLGSLIALWEEDREAMPDIAPRELVKALLEARELPRQALVGPVFPSKSVASEVLNGKRTLTYDFVARLAAFFAVSPAFFFPPSERQPREAPELQGYEIEASV